MHSHESCQDGQCKLVASTHTGLVNHITSGACIQQKLAVRYLLSTVCRLLALLASAIAVAVAWLLALRCRRLSLLATVPIAAKAACATSRSTL